MSCMVSGIKHSQLVATAAWTLWLWRLAHQSPDRATRSKSVLGAAELTWRHRHTHIYVYIYTLCDASRSVRPSALHTEACMWCACLLLHAQPRACTLANLPGTTALQLTPGCTAHTVMTQNHVQTCTDMSATRLCMLHSFS